MVGCQEIDPSPPVSHYSPGRLKNTSTGDHRDEPKNQQCCAAKKSGLYDNDLAARDTLKAKFVCLHS